MVQSLPLQRQALLKNNLPTDKSSKQRWWFIAGREPLLSAAEITALFRPAPISFSPPLIVIDALLDPEAAMPRLGGTIKIAAEIGQGFSEDELLDQIVHDLQPISGKIIFGLSVYDASGDAVQAWGKKIKKMLQETGRSVRYVFNREPLLSSVTVEKNGLTRKGREYIIKPSAAGHYALAVTRAVQPFEQFGARDFGRPGRDDRSGMLPPKLAMMMINIAHGDTQKPLLDPFCGSGTILTEALLLGYVQLIGTDISEKAIQDSKKNIDWIKIKTTQEVNVTLFPADVRILSERVQSVATIVTEPFLGPPRTGQESEAQLKKIAAELTALYKQAFSQFKKVLQPGGVVVCILPRFKFGNGWIPTSEIFVTSLKELGFSVLPLLPKEFSSSPTLLYHRPNQYVGREIWKFVRN